VSDPGRDKRLILFVLIVAGIFILSGLKVDRTATVSSVVSARLEHVVNQIAAVTGRLAQSGI
jgi:hypothetical protein